MTDNIHMRLSVVVPANNEAALIDGCLAALLASDWPHDGGVQVIVVANGCDDDTAQVARARTGAFADKGWALQVIERPEGGKPQALNAGDAAALAPLRAYLDADVTVSPGLLSGLVHALSGPAPAYASGQVQITARGGFSRAYARFWQRVPFMARGVPGCGLFAVNAAGRARWGAFPEIISDDTFVRLRFSPAERHLVSAPYDWPIAEGPARLIRVRRRQDAGVAELSTLYPEALQNDDKAPFPTSDKLRLALRDPAGFAAYAGVALAVALTKGRDGGGWSRGR